MHVRSGKASLSAHRVILASSRSLSQNPCRTTPVIERLFQFISNGTWSSRVPMHPTLPGYFWKLSTHPWKLYPSPEKREGLSLGVFILRDEYPRNLEELHQNQRRRHHVSSPRFTTVKKKSAVYIPTARYTGIRVHRRWLIFTPIPNIHTLRG